MSGAVVAAHGLRTSAAATTVAPHARAAAATAAGPVAGEAPAPAMAATGTVAAVPGGIAADAAGGGGGRAGTVVRNGTLSGTAGHKKRS